MGRPLDVIDCLTVAQNAHDLNAMLACFQEDYPRSEQPMSPARTFHGINQVRKNWSALFTSIPDLHAEIVRSATGRRRECSLRREAALRLGGFQSHGKRSLDFRDLGGGAG